MKVFLGSQSPQVLFGMQQFLEWHGSCRKLERILWSIIKEEEVRLTNTAIQDRMKYEIDREQRKQEVEAAEGVGEIVLPPLTVVIGVCERCQGKVYGEMIHNCETKLTGRIFYKECVQCDYYAEVFKKRNKFYEIVQGGE